MPESSNRMTDIDAHAASFRHDGFVGPIDLLDAKTCRRLTARLKREPVGGVEWAKGSAVRSRLNYEIACLPPITRMLERLLPGPVMLWGASVIQRVPGQKHQWHTDIETAHSNGLAVSIWIGLEGTHQNSGLRLMAGSHRFEQPVQSLAAHHGIDLAVVNDETVRNWACNISSDARIEQPEVGNGQAIFFDGRLWHSSANENRFLARRALLLQYASPDIAIRRPDPNHLAWPFQTIKHPRPPAIMIAGHGTDAMNQLVPPPPDAGGWSGDHLTTIVHPLPDALAPDDKTGWRSHHVLRGQTTQVPDLGCHVSVLSPGATPHPPHEHIEEEILVMLSGQADLTIVEATTGVRTNHTLTPYDFVYYPRQGVRHTLTNNLQAPATYLMFKWRGNRGSESGARLQHQIFRTAEAFNRLVKQSDPFRSALIAEGKTEYLQTLHAHASVVSPGGGYAEHIDAHDVAILLLAGEVKTLGQTVQAPSVIFYAGGRKHGLRNNGNTTVRYLVFEFHGQRNGGLLPTRFDGPAIKAWLRQSTKRAMRRSGLLEGAVRKIANLTRR